MLSFSFFNKSNFSEADRNENVIMPDSSLSANIQIHLYPYLDIPVMLPPVPVILSRS